MTAVDISDPVLHEMRERIVSAHATGMPLRLRGAGTKDFYGEALDGEILETGGYAGIVAYEPSELVITARCGTRLSEIEAALDANGQFLAFEPPAFGADPTIGGVIAAGLSGPRRASAGAARDFVLGASLLTAAGDLLHFGGQVMKNVAGFDVSRLLCGSLGILGLITQASLKVLPKPRAEVTLQFDCDAQSALARFNGWRPQPLPISATSWHAGVAHVRLSGSPSAVRSARESLGGSVLDDHDAATLWRDRRDQRLPLFAEGGSSLWRLSVPATAPLEPAGADLLEWSGALRWRRCGVAAGNEMRRQTRELGGTATLWRGNGTGPMFDALDPASLDLHRRLKREFDPRAIFNRGRMVADL